MRRSRTRRGLPRRLLHAGIQTIAAGALLILLPHVVRASPVGQAFASLATLGWVLAAGGAAQLLVAWSWPRPNGISSGADLVPNGHRGRAGAYQKVDAAPTPTRPRTWSPEVLDVIEWRRLEALVEALFCQAGFETRSQSHGADGGVDVWLHTPLTPDKPVGVVQCKHHRKPVGVDKVRELRGVMAAHGVGRGQFVSTAGFTVDAQAFASENGINLLDGPALLALIGRRTADQQAELLAVATEGEFWRPTCASCGVKMVERTPRGGGRAFWGCVNYPGCRSTLPVRTMSIRDARSGAQASPR